ncbi:Phosphoenolpyruvate carboxylase OS=Castellaniella defragrans OX=75697 GN=ppc PE=3 SV=1 [Castellaniella defragrans]
MPVLTAHPTEVQRKSTLDLHQAIAQQLRLRDAPATPLEAAHRQERLAGLISALWQTRMLRQSKLTVLDKIDNALSYYTAILQHAAAATGWARCCAPARLLGNGHRRCRPTSTWAAWIGGDRDGNPNVSAQTWKWRCCAVRACCAST